ncbi:septum site-determining protein Ssd [Streptomyces sp. NPDC006879]|uniref:septum site-determining protein Ssd n=1 Tax=Streptomyces sp. NPDC006879 TaxID=3364767 RepID=UPI0036C6BC53
MARKLRGAPRATGARPSAPVIVTEDPVLLDDLLRLCAAAGAEPEVRHSVPEPGGVQAEGGELASDWRDAPLVLVGDDAARRVRTGTARRDGVLLVGRDAEDGGIWRRGVQLGAEQVVCLPEAEAWLVDRIADAVEGTNSPATTIGLVGGRGGAGASTLACALAIAAARRGERTVLIDADPLGGGLDVLLGGEAVEGLRWPDFAESRGRVAGGALEEALPELRALRVLSWDRGDRLQVPAEAVRSVLAAARRGGGVVVVDLPRRVDEEVADAYLQLDLALLVVPGEVRAVAAASRVAAAAGLLVRDLRLVTRAPYAAGLGPPCMAELLGLRLVGEVPTEPGSAVAAAGGQPPGSVERGPLARFCGRFWDQVLCEDTLPALTSSERIGGRT